MTQTRNYLLFVMGIICLFSFSLQSQIDPNVPFVNYTYDMKFVMPKAYNTEPMQSDVLIQLGSFDVNQVSSNNGFAETTIGVNVRNPLNLVGTDNRITGFAGTRWIYYTTNGGTSWNSTAFPYSNAGDPVIC